MTARGRLVGAHVLAPAAGELIHELALAVRERRRLRDLAGLVHVYPTYSTSIVQLGARSAFRDAAHLSRLSRAILRPFRVAAARGLSESPPHL